MNLKKDFKEHWMKHRKDRLIVKIKEQIFELAELEKRVEVQGRVISAASRDATRAHHFGMAICATTAVVEHLLCAGLTHEARMILSMTHNMEAAYLNARSATPSTSDGEKK